MGGRSLKFACSGIALLCGLAANGVLAADWVPAGRTKLYRVYVDTQSIDRTGDIVSVWLRQEFTTPLSTEKHNGTYRSTKMLNYYNCAEHEAATSQFITYSGKDGKGKILSNETAASLEYSDVSSDAASKEVFDYVCRRHREK